MRVLLCCLVALARAEDNITVGRFALQLSASQVIQLLALSGKAGDDGFAFSRGGGPAALGDAVLRVRPASWTLKARRPPATFSALRNYPLWSGWHTSDQGVQPLQPKGAAFAAANLSAALVAEATTPSGAALPFDLTRSWERGANDTLVLRYTLTNLASESIEVGGLGATLPFPWAAGSAAGDAASTFLDPSIGGQHGYATVTRLTGTREVLLLTPAAESSPLQSARSSLEAWATAASIGAPGLSAVADVAGGPEPRREGSGSASAQGGLAGTAVWLTHSKAFAQSEWVESGKPWLRPSSRILTPAGTPSSSMQFALAFSVAPNVRGKSAALYRAGNAEVLGVPGYILGTDMTTAHLLVRPPPGATLAKASTDEPQALEVGAVQPAATKGWSKVSLAAKADGQPRLYLNFTDGSSQVVAYRTLPPFDAHIDRYGAFAASTFFEAPDAFQRSPSCMPWDREDKSHVLDDARNVRCARQASNPPRATTDCCRCKACPLP